MLNKRIFAVALEVWYEYWALDDHDLEMLVCADEKVRLLVRRLDFVPASQSLLVFQKEMLVLRTFTRVTTFALYGKLGSSTKPHLPAALCRVLTTFKYLTSLTLDLQTRFVLSDTDFSIGRDLPRLQQLHLGPNCACARQLLRFPCPSLRHLDLAYNNEGEEDDVYPVIPWSSLVSLDIYLGTGTADFRPLERFNKSLQLALFPHQNQFGPPASLPLRSLRIHDQLFRPDSLNDSSKDALEQLSMHSFGRLLELLGCTSIAHLQLYPHYALRIPVDMPVLASLPSLELRNSKLDLSEEEHLTALFNLLHLFPNLCYLRLKRAIFAPFVDAVERQLHPPDSLAFLTRHPSLSALLHALSATNILQFTCVIEMR
ncbi:hypothetical protein JCM8097_005616 [Rhodosporidiobolus ruineniae]